MGCVADTDNICAWKDEAKCAFLIEGRCTVGYALGRLIAPWTPSDEERSE